MKKIVALLVSAAVLTACASVHESYSADGRKAYTLNCSGMARGWDKCFSAAGDLCKEAGFDVLDRASEGGSIGAGGFSGGSGSFGGGSTQERSMVVACKKPAA
ncbi:hypothetical protein A9R05_07395 [Burkholderia sp. KK1]|nr:hypothetical protein A9R05_07395 [Burkholderia sp. KK1]